MGGEETQAVLREGGGGAEGPAIFSPRVTPSPLSMTGSLLLLQRALCFLVNTIELDFNIILLDTQIYSRFDTFYVVVRSKF